MGVKHEISRALPSVVCLWLSWMVGANQLIKVPTIVMTCHVARPLTRVSGTVYVLAWLASWSC